MRRHAGGMELIRQLVRQEQWDFSLKVQESLKTAQYDLEDLVECVCTGEMHKRERDEKNTAWDGNKWTIHGRMVSGCPFYVVGKIKQSDDQSLFFFITAHRRE